MTWPSVTINQLNQRQGTINEVERTLLFVGPAARGVGNLIVLNSQSDIATELSEASEALINNVTAAQLNAGQNWQAYALLIPSSAKSWPDEVEQIMHLVSVEGVVIIASSTASTVQAWQALREKLIAGMGRWVWFIVGLNGPLLFSTQDSEEPGISWKNWIATASAIVSGVTAAGVQITPLLWGNEAGVLAGRLCNRSVTIADSPARVKTGALLGLSNALPVDVEGTELTLAHLRQLHNIRYSVPMWYTDYEGMYWSDGLTLDVTGGDYPVIEYLRIVDKAARRVRVQAIAKIADRTLNSTPASIATHKTYFTKTLRTMAKTTQISGVTFPGEVKTPESGDVNIVWYDSKTVAIYLIVRPYASAKSITVGITLDDSITESTS
ncbi:DUF2586 domain-containing protein [Erwinia tracheiphila]|uniref:DUF2586 domain-containing protein n=1 Tax=Erwinia tracheiphila TaxID=65700 RepID=UPI001F172326|nr:DUF2586 domain-containing protein [Erwinia tracheiphila]UIA90717.1 DUF2586 domain-containing protein [Erwinia tracheiphila]